MRRHAVTAALQIVLAGLCSLQPLAAMAKTGDINIAIIAHALRNDESQLREVLGATDFERFAFVLVNGIKQGSESCHDELYQQRKALLDNARNRVVVSLAASDWTACLNGQNKPAAIERLNRLRELFFNDEAAPERDTLRQLHQSGSAKFRNYVENARWQIRGIQFATVNLPADNNHYLSEAGRNSEFEDRQIATNDWLQRIVSAASRNKLPVIVLFCDGNPMAPAAPEPLFGSPSRRDGFREVRRKITALAAKYRGNILIVHGQAGATGAKPAAIVWQKNIGSLAAGQGSASAWMKLTVNPAAANPFRVTNQPVTGTGDKEREK